MDAKNYTGFRLVRMDVGDTLAFSDPVSGGESSLDDPWICYYCLRATEMNLSKGRS